jgi:hypothetical protein
VRDLIKVLVRGGVPVEFPQALEGEAGADGAGGVQGGGADGGGVDGSPVAIVRLASLAWQSARERAWPAVCPATAAVSRSVARTGLRPSIARSARVFPVFPVWKAAL